MAKVKAKNHFIHLGVGIFLSPTGKIVDKLPTDDSTKVIRLPFEINFPDFIKDELNGQDLNKEVQ